MPQSPISLQSVGKLDSAHLAQGLTHHTMEWRSSPSCSCRSQCEILMTDGHYRICPLEMQCEGSNPPGAREPLCKVNRVQFPHNIKLTPSPPFMPHVNTVVTAMAVGALLRRLAFAAHFKDGGRALLHLTDLQNLRKNPIFLRDLIPSDCAPALSKITLRGSGRAVGSQLFGVNIIFV